MSKKKSKVSNLLFIVLIALLIIPQTRTFIQVNLQKALVKVNPFGPELIAENEQIQLTPFDYKLQSIDGINREAPIGKGKITFIGYWATWCAGCIAEMPSIAALYADYGNKIDFLLITQEEPEVVARFLEKKELNVPTVIARMATPQKLKESSIPTNYIIDQTGKIVLKEQGAANWNSEDVRSFLDSLLATSE